MIPRGIATLCLYHIVWQLCGMVLRPSIRCATVSSMRGFCILLLLFLLELNIEAWTNPFHFRCVRQLRCNVSPTPIDGAAWPQKFPAKEHCSRCGLCETSFVTNVTNACAFLPELGMRRMDELEVAVHGRSRNVESMVWSRSKRGSKTAAESGIAEEARFGVLHEPVRLVRGIGMPGAQWTGVVTSICVSMLESGQVDAVVCIAAGSDNNWSSPEPILARNKHDVLRGRGVKPALAPSLKVLDEIKNDASIRRLLFCGVGCAVQAFRVIQDDLKLEQVYVLGTNCVDNSPTPQAAEAFLRDGLKVDIQSSSVRGYEFMQDYRVHVKTKDSYITKPYFSLPGSIAEQSIAKSCLSCFDYTNGLADVVIGYMGAPLAQGQRMDQADQTLTVRNERGAAMIHTAVVAGRLQLGEIATSSSSAGSTGKHFETLAAATVNSDAQVQAMVGGQVRENGMPVWMGEILAFVLRSTGPTGINFARYSIDYHILRNYLHVLEQSKAASPDQAVAATKNALPLYAKRIVEFYLDSDKTIRNLESKIAKAKARENMT